MGFKLLICMFAIYFNVVMAQYQYIGESQGGVQYPQQPEILTGTDGTYGQPDNRIFGLFGGGRGGGLLGGGGLFSNLFGNLLGNRQESVAQPAPATSTYPVSVPQYAGGYQSYGAGGGYPAAGGGFPATGSGFPATGSGFPATGGFGGGYPGYGGGSYYG